MDSSKRAYNQDGFKMNQELMEGRLCEKGFLKERYDNQINDLVRTFTEKGINEIKEMLRSKHWREELVKMIKELPVSPLEKRNIAVRILNLLNQKI